MSICAVRVPLGDMLVPTRPCVVLGVWLYLSCILCICKNAAVLQASRECTNGPEVTYSMHDAQAFRKKASCPGGCYLRRVPPREKGRMFRMSRNLVHMQQQHMQERNQVAWCGCCAEYSVYMLSKWSICCICSVFWSASSTLGCCICG